MAVPAKRLILSNLETTLQGITTGNGYKTDVATVSLVTADWDGARAFGAWPVLCLMPRATIVQHQPFGLMRTTLPVDIVAHLEPTSDSDAYDKLEDLIDDVIAAVSVDPRRGGNAIDTMVDNDNTDEGDPDKKDHKGRTGSLVMRLRIIFERDTSQS